MPRPTKSVRQKNAERVRTNPNASGNPSLISGSRLGGRLAARRAAVTSSRDRPTPQIQVLLPKQVTRAIEGSATARASVLVMTDIALADIDLVHPNYEFTIEDVVYNTRQRGPPFDPTNPTYTAGPFSVPINPSTGKYQIKVVDASHTWTENVYQIFFSIKNTSYSNAQLDSSSSNTPVTTLPNQGALLIENLKVKLTGGKFGYATVPPGTIPANDHFTSSGTVKNFIIDNTSPLIDPSTLTVSIIDNTGGLKYGGYDVATSGDALFISGFVEEANDLSIDNVQFTTSTGAAMHHTPTHSVSLHSSTTVNGVTKNVYAFQIQCLVNNTDANGYVNWSFQLKDNVTGNTTAVNERTYPNSPYTIAGLYNTNSNKPLLIHRDAPNVSIDTTTTGNWKLFDSTGATVKQFTPAAGSTLNYILESGVERRFAKAGDVINFEFSVNSPIGVRPFVEGASGSGSPVNNYYFKIGSANIDISSLGSSTTDPFTKTSSSANYELGTVQTTTTGSPTWSNFPCTTNRKYSLSYTIPSGPSYINERISFGFEIGDAAGNIQVINITTNTPEIYVDTVAPQITSATTSLQIIPKQANIDFTNNSTTVGIRRQRSAVATSLPATDNYLSNFEGGSDDEIYVYLRTTEPVINCEPLTAGDKILKVTDLSTGIPSDSTNSVFPREYSATNNASTSFLASADASSTTTGGVTYYDNILKLIIGTGDNGTVDLRDIALYDRAGNQGNIVSGTYSAQVPSVIADTTDPTLNTFVFSLKRGSTTILPKSDNTFYAKAGDVLEINLEASEPLFIPNVGSGTVNEFEPGIDSLTISEATVGNFTQGNRTVSKLFPANFLDNNYKITFTVPNNASTAGGINLNDDFTVAFDMEDEAGNSASITKTQDDSSTPLSVVLDNISPVTTGLSEAAAANDISSGGQIAPGYYNAESSCQGVNVVLSCANDLATDVDKYVKYGKVDIERGIVSVGVKDFSTATSMGQYDITDASVSNLICSIPESTFEAGAQYVDGNEVAFRYKVTDAASNESGWKEISDTLKIDLTAPKEDITGTTSYVGGTTRTFEIPMSEPIMFFNGGSITDTCAFPGRFTVEIAGSSQTITSVKIKNAASSGGAFAIPGDTDNKTLQVTIAATTDSGNDGEVSYDASGAIAGDKYYDRAWNDGAAFNITGINCDNTPPSSTETASNKAIFRSDRTDNDQKCKTGDNVTVSFDISETTLDGWQSGIDTSANAIVSANLKGKNSSGVDVTIAGSLTSKNYNGGAAARKYSVTFDAISTTSVVDGSLTCGITVQDKDGNNLSTILTSSDTVTTGAASGEAVTVNNASGAGSGVSRNFVLDNSAPNLQSGTSAIEQYNRWDASTASYLGWTNVGAGPIYLKKDDKIRLLIETDIPANDKLADDFSSTNSSGDIFNNIGTDIGDLDIANTGTSAGGRRLVSYGYTVAAGNNGQFLFKNMVLADDINNSTSLTDHTLVAQLDTQNPSFSEAFGVLSSGGADKSAVGDKYYATVGDTPEIRVTVTDNSINTTPGDIIKNLVVKYGDGSVVNSSDITLSHDGTTGPGTEVFKITLPAISVATPEGALTWEYNVFDLAGNSIARNLSQFEVNGDSEIVVVDRTDPLNLFTGVGSSVETKTFPSGQSQDGYFNSQVDDVQIVATLATGNTITNLDTNIVGGTIKMQHRLSGATTWLDVPSGNSKDNELNVINTGPAGAGEIVMSANNLTLAWEKNSTDGTSGFLQTYSEGNTVEFQIVVTDAAGLNVAEVSIPSLTVNLERPVFDDGAGEMPHSYEDATGDLLVKLTDSCNFYNTNNGTEKSPNSLAAFTVKAVDNAGTDFVLTFTSANPNEQFELSDEDGNVVTNTGTASGTAGAAFAAGNYLKISMIAGGASTVSHVVGGVTTAGLPANVVSFTVEYDDTGVSSDEKLFDVAWNDFGDSTGKSSIGDGSIIPWTNIAPNAGAAGLITGFAAKFVDITTGNLVAPSGKSNDRDNSQFKFEITLGAGKEVKDFQDALLMTGGELQIRHRLSASAAAFQTLQTYDIVESSHTIVGNQIKVNASGTIAIDIAKSDVYALYTNGQTVEFQFYVENVGNLGDDYNTTVQVTIDTTKPKFDTASTPQWETLAAVGGKARGRFIIELTEDCLFYVGGADSATPLNNNAFSILKTGTSDVFGDIVGLSLWDTGAGAAAVPQNHLQITIEEPTAGDWPTTGTEPKVDIVYDASSGTGIGTQQSLYDTAWNNFAGDETPQWKQVLVNVEADTVLPSLALNNLTFKDILENSRTAIGYFNNKINDTAGGVENKLQAIVNLGTNTIGDIDGNMAGGRLEIRAKQGSTGTYSVLKSFDVVASGAVGTQINTTDTGSVVLSVDASEFLKNGVGGVTSTTYTGSFEDGVVYFQLWAVDNHENEQQLVKSGFTLGSEESLIVDTIPPDFEYTGPNSSWKTTVTSGGAGGTQGEGELLVLLDDSVYAFDAAGNSVNTMASLASWNAKYVPGGAAADVGMTVTKVEILNGTDIANPGVLTTGGGIILRITVQESTAGDWPSIGGTQGNIKIEYDSALQGVPAKLYDDAWNDFAARNFNTTQAQAFDADNTYSWDTIPLSGIGAADIAVITSNPIDTSGAAKVGDDVKVTFKLPTGAIDYSAASAPSLDVVFKANGAQFGAIISAAHIAGTTPNEYEATSDDLTAAASAGAITIEITYSDLAGNTTTHTETPGITFDKTAPDLLSTVDPADDWGTSSGANNIKVFFDESNKNLRVKFNESVTILDSNNSMGGGGQGGSVGNSGAFTVNSNLVSKFSGTAKLNGVTYNIVYSTSPAGPGVSHIRIFGLFIKSTTSNKEAGAANADLTTWNVNNGTDILQIQLSNSDINTVTGTPGGYTFVAGDEITMQYTPGSATADINNFIVDRSGNRYTGPAGAGATWTVTVTK